MHWPGTVPCPTGDRPKQPCDGRRRQLFQRPLFAYLTFSYFVRSIVLLAGFSTALQWWQYYALRGIHERDSDLQSNIGAPKSKVWVFLEGHKIKKNLCRTFDKSVLFCERNSVLVKNLTNIFQNKCDQV